MFNIIKRYYKLGIYKTDDVKIFVKSGVLSETQFKEMTGEKYTKK